ncbi:hypothetical protein OF829_00865 [Sphingomonas sp. LB-2]|uniref:hypothetical protein n=1 Tax=Sphingomonas caeni TaxID=2984949 RepID=UPI002231F2DA|nr:hypothetical protein [Sphingomonas caeni]MCW3845772.1 hypothetical protein [Sphingomonas caeni]
MSADLPHNMLVVATDGSVLAYNENAGNWGSLGYVGGWSLKTLTFDPQGYLYLVGTDGNVKSMRSMTVDQSAWHQISWTIDWLAFKPGDMELWCVGTEGNVGTLLHDAWTDYGNWGGWTLRMIAFDSKGGLWGVGTEGNLGYWNAATGAWEDQTAAYGGWTLNMVAFDANDTLWCVGTGGNIGKAGEKGWEDSGTVDGKAAKSIAFQLNPFPS